MTTQPAPRFARGQRVRIIANQGGLYSAQIGVVGVISKQRQYRRWGHHTYDVGYQDERGRDKIVTRVREDDIEPVEAIADAPETPDMRVEIETQGGGVTGIAIVSSSASCDHEWLAMPNDDVKPRLRRCLLCGVVETGCAHTWQMWPDVRYRHCPKCKASERVGRVVVPGNSEVTR